MALNVKPLGDRVLVEIGEEKEVKKGGIIIGKEYKIFSSDDLIAIVG